MSIHSAIQAAEFLLGLPHADALDRMLDLAEATSGDAVAVAGPQAADAMVGLWRRGFARVEAARRATCAAADERCGLLLVVGCPEAVWADTLVGAVLGMLAPGGRLVVDAGRLVDVSERAELCGYLRARGLLVSEGSELSAEILAMRRTPS
ncbi:MAG: hypothetical protein ABW063_05605 [Caulobacter sp.]